MTSVRLEPAALWSRVKHSTTEPQPSLSKGRPQNWFPRLIIAQCRSKVLQNAPKEHSAILSTFIRLPLSSRTLLCVFLSGRFGQILLYVERQPPNPENLYLCMIHKTKGLLVEGFQIISDAE